MQLKRTLATLLVAGLLVTAGCAGPGDDPGDATPTEQADVPAEGNGTVAPGTTPTPTPMTDETPTVGMMTETPTDGMMTETPTDGMMNGTETPMMNGTATSTPNGTATPMANGTATPTATEAA